MNETIRILIIEDLPRDADVAEEEVTAALGSCDIRRVGTLKAYTAALENFRPMVIVGGCDLSCFDEMAAIRQAGEILPGVPLVILTEAEKEKKALACLQAGAWDYVLKEQLQRFSIVLHNAVRKKHRQINEAPGDTASRKRERQIANLIENLPGVAYRCHNDPSWTMVSVSKGCFGLTGYHPEELENNHFIAYADVIHPKDRKRVTREIQQSLRRFERFQVSYRLINRRGEVRWAGGQGVGIWENGAWLLDGFVWDMTDLKQSEEALGREKEKFRILMEGSPLGMFLLDSNDRITYMNARFRDIFGYADKEITTGNDWLENAYPDTEYRQQILRTWQEDLKTARHGGSPPRKYTARAKDGSEMTILFFFMVLKDEEQLIVCQDITRQESLEAQFMHAQKMESIGRLASGMAHDFNNLLTTIIGNADFALMDLNENDPSHEVIGEIKDAANRATHLTRQLLAFSRRQRRNPEVLDLNSRLQEIMKMLTRLIGETIELKLNPAPDIKPVEMDPGQLEQVIMNLAVNARDAMPDGGRLTIETANVELSEDDPVSPVELIPGEYVLLSISDTGSGIPRHIRNQVFDPFFTTKEKGKGTGLGLSTVYGIIKQNHGNTILYSEPGQGTTFKIFLPVHIRASAGARKQAAGNTRLYGNETILLAEDEERVRKVVAMMLIRYGYKVVEAGDGREGRRVFDTAHPPVKLLLTDMVMPGMSGLELAVSLREARPDLKVLCMSGYTDSALYEGVQKEAFEFIHKPFTSRTLIEKIRQLLDE